MPRRNRDTKAILRTIERSDQRSTLFWWMVDHYDEMVGAAKRRRISWGAFCAEAAKQGLTDTRGHPPSEANARKTWSRARAAVEQARAEDRASRPVRPGSVYPSRIPKDWKPEAVRPAVIPAPVVPMGTSLVPASPADQEPYDWRKRLGQLTETINARSGRKG
jgi:hypothetical protein